MTTASSWSRLSLTDWLRLVDMRCVHLSILLAAIFSAWLLQTVSNNHDNQSVATVLCRIQNKTSAKSKSALCACGCGVWWNCAICLAWRLILWSEAVMIQVDHVTWLNWWGKCVMWCAYNYSVLGCVCVHVCVCVCVDVCVCVCVRVRVCVCVLFEWGVYMLVFLNHTHDRLKDLLTLFITS